MPTSTMLAPVVVELNRQFNQELAAAHHYLAISLWCEAQNFSGCAAFFAKQASEEREHAGKLIKHLLHRGQSPLVAALPAPRTAYGSLLDVALQAQALEVENSRGIHAAYEAALDAKDYPAQVLLHWFINEQVEEEAWCANLVARVQGALCAGSLASLDSHVEKLLASE